MASQLRAAALLFAAVQALVVTFNNIAPVLDVNGAQVDAHDGMIVQHKPNGLYYRYSIEYGLYSEVGHLRSNGGGCANHCTTCGGFRFDHNVSVWTSPTLGSGTWTLVTREALPIATRPLATYYRPKVLYNPSTQQYVLWVNYAPGGYGNAGHVSFYAKHPAPTKKTNHLKPFKPNSTSPPRLHLPRDPLRWQTETSRWTPGWETTGPFPSVPHPLRNRTSPPHQTARDYDLFRDVDGSAYVLVS